MNKEINYWFRWISFLPAALIAGLIVSFPLHLVLYTSLTNFIEPYPESLERIVFPFFFSLTFILTGYKIAPAHKIKVAIILFGLLMFFIGGVAFLALFRANFFGYGLFFQGGGAATLLAAIGAAVGVYLAWQKQTKT